MINFNTNLLILNNWDRQLNRRLVVIINLLHNFPGNFNHFSLWDNISDKWLFWLASSFFVIWELFFDINRSPVILITHRRWGLRSYRWLFRLNKWVKISYCFIQILHLLWFWFYRLRFSIVTCIRIMKLKLRLGSIFHLARKIKIVSQIEWARCGCLYEFWRRFFGIGNVHHLLASSLRFDSYALTILNKVDKLRGGLFMRCEVAPRHFVIKSCT